MSLLLHHVRHERRAPYQRGPHRAFHEDTLEISLVSSGRDIGRVETQPIHVTPGEYVLIPAKRVHSSWTERQAVGFVVMHLGVDALIEVAGEQGYTGAFASGTFGATAAQRTAMLELGDSDADGDAAWVLERESLVQRIAVGLVERHQRPTQRRHARTAYQGLRRAAELMRAEPGTPLSLGQLARTAGLSRAHFLRSFKRAYGVTPHAYLIEQRLEQAAILMRSSELPLTAVAHQLGFASSSRFGETWKKRHGMTPSAWRRALYDKR